jgi:hypothetical protein
MGLIDTIERTNLQELAAYADVPLPKRTWRTPDRRWWTPQMVLSGWRKRISDHWAWLALHTWVVEGQVVVRHLELPTPLNKHSASDPAWAFIDQHYGPGESTPLTHPAGQADLACRGGKIIVEFGTCAPVRFVLNLGCSANVHWMLVPYGCDYAFVFVPQTGPLLRCS